MTARAEQPAHFPSNLFLIVFVISVMLIICCPLCNVAVEQYSDHPLSLALDRLVLSLRRAQADCHHVHRFQRMAPFVTITSDSGISGTFALSASGASSLNRGWPAARGRRPQTITSGRPTLSPSYWALSGQR